MPTVTVGYDSAGSALDYTTLASAISGATAGDTLEMQYSGTAKEITWSNIASQNVSKNLTIQSGISGRKISIRPGTGAEIFSQSTGSVTVTLRDLDMSHATVCIDVEAGSSGTTLNIDRCRLGGENGIFLRDASTATINVTSCEFFPDSRGIFHLSTAGTINVENSAVVGSSNLGFVNNTSGTFNCWNCVAIRCKAGSGFSGTIGGTHNASDDNSHPATNGVDLRVVSTLMMIDGSNGYSAYSTRPVDASCLLVGAGTDRSLTTDFDGKAINQTTSANIGPYGVTVPLSVPTTATTPADFTAADAGTDGALTVTISNGVGYDAGTKIDVYDNGTGNLLGSFDALAGTGTVYGLTNDTEYELYGKASYTAYTDSARSGFSSATPTLASPTAPGTLSYSGVKTTTSVNLYYEAASGFTAGTIYAKAKASGIELTQAASNGANTFTGLTAGNTYTFYVYPDDGNRTSNHVTVAL